MDFQIRLFVYLDVDWVVVLDKLVDLMPNLKIDWLLAVTKCRLKMHPLSEVLL